MTISDDNSKIIWSYLRTITNFEFNGNNSSDKNFVSLATIAKKFRNSYVQFSSKIDFKQKMDINAQRRSQNNLKNLQEL